MAKYIAKPTEVEAYKIILVTQENPFSQTSDYWGYVTVEYGENIRISKEMTSRMEPKIGDYFVRGHDGYRYLNPKDVFEAKYCAADEQTEEVCNKGANTFENAISLSTKLYKLLQNEQNETIRAAIELVGKYLYTPENAQNSNAIYNIQQGALQQSDKAPNLRQY